MSFDAPAVDYAGLSPVIALLAGICAVIGASVAGRVGAALVRPLTIAALAASAGLCVWQWGERKDIVAAALRVDELALAAALIVLVAAAFAVLLAAGDPAAELSEGEGAGRGEFHALLLGSVLGMVLLAQAQNLITFFIAIETLSIPLYVLCATNLRRAASLESGLKYLVIGSLGSATLLYGMALIYGGAGATGFAEIAAGISREGALGDPLVLVGIALVATGLAFKVSIAPFHQWTPDVYQGAPTPVTAFMAVATKAAAFAVLARFFLVALAPEAGNWDVALGFLAAFSIAVGNIGALGQRSLKRLLGYSGVAQAGYMLGGVVVASEAGVNALVFYLAVYALMNLAAFAVIVARERETTYGDDIRAVEGLGAQRPLLAWPLTIAMLALAGLPGTAGFIGKLYLVEALVEGDETWLAVAIALGTMVSLAYYLRVVAAVWMRPAPATAAADGTPAIAGASPEADATDPRAGRRAHLVVPALVAAAATVALGIAPQPLVDWAEGAGAALAEFL